MNIFSFLSIFCFLSSRFCPETNENSNKIDGEKLENDVKEPVLKPNNVEEIQTENGQDKLEKQNIENEKSKLDEKEKSYDMEQSKLPGGKNQENENGNVKKIEEKIESENNGENREFGLLRVMTLNTWIAGQMVENGLQKIAKHIRQVDADIILLQEMRKERLKSLIEELGQGWDRIEVDTDEALITKHQIVSKQNIPLTGIGIGASIHIPRLNMTVNAISVHLNPFIYGPHEFVFGKGSTSEREKMAMRGDFEENGRWPGRLVGINKLLEYPFVKEAMQKSTVVGPEGEALILGGDFNEPSHFDWTEDTIHQHGGFKFEWPVTKRLAKVGLIDSFRRLHPDEAEEPGNTWSPIQKHFDPDNWQEGDHEPQDRIDFIFYRSHRLRPLFSFVYVGEQAKNNEKPNFKENNWPSDHAAVVTDFEVL